MQRNFVAAVAIAGTLTACGTPAVDREAQIEARIVQACVATGLFRALVGPVLSAVPQTALPAMVVGAGLDIACADPARIARDAAAVAAVLHALGEVARARAAQ